MKDFIVKALFSLDLWQNMGFCKYCMHCAFFFFL